ncbi:leucine-rich repeat-containing protein 52-like [Amblyraja radiata]|uniref:leucine-rich repeat-containing protein 52-like n=1 Tax=Amblyraja radiata TaxID=386614 RepID=UPI0014030F59|nr:leucine-rich repeat-containing protein 52-like [Amblyraja radiata]XP_032883919.1 leucine-rich repeat-containing protein 52-like [Amblyraja radiata]
MDDYFMLKGLRLLSVFLIAKVVRVTGCPYGCNCSQFSINCTGAHLQQFPLDIPFATKQLLFCNNNISSLPVHLNYLGGLVHLDLSNNSLAEISQSALVNMQRLVYLDLSRNRLRELTHLAFSYLANMVVLKVSGNKELTFVDSRALSANSKLQDLDLSGNGLTFIDVNILSALTHLRSVRLAGNPWACNCNSETLISWIRRNRRIIPDVAEVTCAFPDSLQGVLVTELADRLFPLCHRKREFKLSEVLYFCLIGPGLFSASIALNLTFSLLMVLYKRIKKKDMKHYRKLRRAISFKYSKRPNIIIQQINTKAFANGGATFGVQLSR